MSTEENKVNTRRAIEESWNQGNVAIFDKLCAPNYIHHDSAQPNVRSQADYKRWVTETRSAFSGLRVTIEDLIAEGEQVVTRWTLRGANSGDIVRPIRIPATG
jgi:predicted ester cyclase